MSAEAKSSAGASPLQTPLPSWIGSGIIGLVLGAGCTLIAMRFYEPSTSRESASEPGGKQGAGGRRSGPGGPGGMGGGMAGGPASNLNRGMGPAAGPGGMGGGMGGFGPRPKQNLTSFVGKLDLLTRETLHVELTPEQRGKIAEKLVQIDKRESLTDEDATAQLQELEALLSPEQKAVTDSIRLPINRAGGMSPGGPGPAPEENPFRQETNKKQLQDLVARIQPGSIDPKKDSASESAQTANSEAEKDKSTKPDSKPEAGEKT